MAREFEKIDGAVDVGFRVELRLAQRRTHARARGQVHDAVEVVLIEELVQCGAIANVEFDEFIAWVFEVFADVFAFNLWFVEVVEVVNNCNLIDISAQQPIDKMRSDKASATGYEKVFHRALFVAYIHKCQPHLEASLASMERGSTR